MSVIESSSSEDEECPAKSNNKTAADKTVTVPETPETSDQ